MNKAQEFLAEFNEKQLNDQGALGEKKFVESGPYMGAQSAVNKLRKSVDMLSEILDDGETGDASDDDISKIYKAVEKNIKDVTKAMKPWR